MRNMTILVFILVVLVFAGCGPETLERSNILDPKYNSGGEGVVQGFVRYNGAPIGGAVVTITNSGLFTTSNSTGYYSITKSKIGNITVVASAPWYKDATQLISLSAGEVKIVDLSLSSSQVTGSPFSFSSYTLGVSPPSPWSVFITGSSSNPTVINIFSLSPSQSCKLTCGNAIGNYSELKYTGLNATKGIRAKAAIYLPTIGNANFMLKLKDASGTNGPEIGINNGLFYAISPSGFGQNITGPAPTFGTWYYVEIIFDAEMGNAVYNVYNSANSLYSTPLNLVNTSKPAIDKLAIVNYANVATSMDCYVDDIDVIKK